MQSVGRRGVPEHTSGSGCWFPTQRDVEAFKKGKRLCRHLCQERGRHTQACFFGSPRHLLLVPPWPSKLRDGRQRAHVLLRFRGLERHAAPKARTRLRRRGSSASDRRRSQRRRQVRCATGFPPPFPHASRKTVILTSFRLWVTSVGPSHHLLRQMWSSVLETCGRAVPQLQRISRLNLATPQIEVGAVSKQMLPGWTVEHVRRPTGRGDDLCGAVGILRGGARPLWTQPHPKKQRVAPQAAVLEHWERFAEAIHNRGPGIAALGPGSARFAGGVRAQRSAGDKACFQGRGFSCSQSSKHGPSQTLAIASDEEAVPHNIWNSLLSAMAHFHMRDAPAGLCLQRRKWAR